MRSEEVPIATISETQGFAILVILFTGQIRIGSPGKETIEALTSLIDVDNIPLEVNAKPEGTPVCALMQSKTWVIPSRHQHETDGCLSFVTIVGRPRPSFGTDDLCRSFSLQFDILPWRVFTFTKRNLSHFRCAHSTEATTNQAQKNGAVAGSHHKKSNLGCSWRALIESMAFHRRSRLQRTQPRSSGRPQDITQAKIILQAKKYYERKVQAKHTQLGLFWRPRPILSASLKFRSILELAFRVSCFLFCVETRGGKT